jgi:hypothetical protein
VNVIVVVCFRAKKRCVVYYRCRDDFFLTWNDSKDHFLTLFNETVANEQQQPRLPVPMAIIGSTVHLLDLEVGHHQGNLCTKIYHHSKSDADELPNKFEYHTCGPSKLLQAALKRAVRCCSSETDFHREVRYMKNAHMLRGFSPAFGKQSIQDFYMQFDVGEKRDGVFTVPYDKLRQRVLEHDRQQAELKKQHEDQKRNIIRIPYPNHLDQQVAVDMKNDILHILQQGMSNREALNDLQVECVPRPQTPLTINDYLVDKRPPLSLLTLPDSLERRA